MTWPDHFPENCPPIDASRVEGQYFRLVTADPPVEWDVMSHKERDPGKNWGSGQCRACGLSIYGDEEEARKTRRRIPALRGTKVAIANVTPASGVVAPTPTRTAKSHCTWWVFEKFKDTLGLLGMVNAS